jgi:hypothetical protein
LQAHLIDSASDASKQNDRPKNKPRHCRVEHLQSPVKPFLLLLLRLVRRLLQHPRRHAGFVSLHTLSAGRSAGSPEKLPAGITKNPDHTTSVGKN